MALQFAFRGKICSITPRSCLCALCFELRAQQSKMRGELGLDNNSTTMSKNSEETPHPPTEIVAHLITTPSDDEEAPAQSPQPPTYREEDIRTTPELRRTQRNLLEGGEDDSFWGLTPRWVGSIYQTASRTAEELAEMSNPFYSDSGPLRDDGREVACAVDEQEEFQNRIIIAPVRSMLDDDELSSLGNTDTGPLSMYSERGLHSLFRGGLLMGLVVTGVALVISLATRSNGMSWVNNVRSSVTFSKKRSTRYFPMKERLVLISGAAAFEDEMSPQHRALVFLADGDPLVLDPNDSATSTQLSQRYALAVFYYATNGPSWKHRTYWLTGQHECGWQFVICSDIEEHANTTSQIATSDAAAEETNDAFLNAVDADLGTGHIVTGLQLYNNSIQGILPTELTTAVPYLMTLDLGNNFLQGTLQKYGQLVHLRTLFLNSNNFTGSIPHDLISGLSRLKTLAIADNKVTGQIPTEMFEGLVSLERLSLGGNQLTGPLPDIFDRLAMLQEVSLGENYLSGTILPSLLGSAGRPSLMTKCDLHGNQFTGQLPAATNAPELKFLYLYDNKLQGTIPGDLLCQASNTLADVRLSNNSFSGRIPSLSCTMAEVQLLSLASNELTGPIPSSLGDVLPRVREIHLFENMLTSTIPDSLFNPPNLTALLLEDNGLTGSITETMFNSANKLELFYASANMLSGNIDAIAAATSLVKLRLEYNAFTGTVPFMNSPKLQLFYAYNNSLTGILRADTYGPSIRKLKLSNNTLSGKIMLGAAGSLEVLSLNGNAFTGNIPIEMSEMKNLKTLNLRRNRLSGTVPSELQQLSRLEELQLDFNNFSGEVASELCNLRDFFLKILVADCGGSQPKVSCSCCTECF